MKIEELVEKAQNGDQEAFAAVCRRFEGLVKKHACAGHVRACGEDAASEAWVAMVQAVKSYRRSQGVPFAGYAESRVKYAIWNLYKRERRKWQNEIPLEARQDDDGGSVLDTLADSTDVLAEVELRLASPVLRRAVRDLPEKQRQAVMGTLIEEMRLADVAARLGVSVQAVHNLKNRGLARLKKQCTGM